MDRQKWGFQRPRGSKTEERQKTDREDAERRQKKRENKSIKIVRGNKALLNDLESFLSAEVSFENSWNGLGAPRNNPKGSEWGSGGVFKDPGCQFGNPKEPRGVQKSKTSIGSGHSGDGPET